LHFSLEREYLRDIDCYVQENLILQNYRTILSRFSWRFFVARKLYIGNLPFSATEDAIREYFAQVGEVHSVKIITDRETQKSRGFCFVEMENADTAIAELNGKELDGRKITVSEAREREERSGGGGGYRGGSGGGGNRDRGGFRKKRFNDNQQY
jgi:RNA recognition motif-containing protein